MMHTGNIFLVGPMGAGKTTVGRRLAELRRMDFVDSDQEIERRTGVDIAYIFEKEAEAGFRAREAKVIEDLSRRFGVVMATGGGAILDGDSRKALSARGYVVYLHADIVQQLRRTGRTSHRPLLQNDNPEETLRRLFEVRDPLYREVADLVIETRSRPAKVLADEINAALEGVTATTD